MPKTLLKIQKVTRHLISYSLNSESTDHLGMTFFTKTNELAIPHYYFPSPPTKKPSKTRPSLTFR